jgi:hypothetical protein
MDNVQAMPLQRVAHLLLEMLWKNGPHQLGTFCGESTEVNRYSTFKTWLKTIPSVIFMLVLPILD